MKQAQTSLNKNDTGDLNLFEDVHDAIISPVMFSIVTQVKGYKKKYGKLDTSFLLRNLLYCSHCNSPFKTKDNSPKGKSKEYLVYKCQHCKVSIPANTIHEEVIADLSKKWTSNMHQLIEESKSALSGWLQTLKSCKKSVEQTEERILFNERMLSQQEVTDDINSIINNSKKIINDEKQRLNKAIEKINLLNNDMALYEVYSHFKNADITSLFNSELRTLYLAFLEQVKLRVKSDNDFTLSIKYRLNPFVEIENDTVQITEKLLKQLPVKPKGIKQAQ